MKHTLRLLAIILFISSASGMYLPDSCIPSPEKRLLYARLNTVIAQKAEESYHAILQRAQALKELKTKPLAIAVDIDDTLVLGFNTELFFTHAPPMLTAMFARPAIPHMLKLFKDLEKTEQFTFFFITARSDVLLDKNTRQLSASQANTESVKDETIYYLQQNGYSKVVKENLFCYPKELLDMSTPRPPSAWDVCQWKQTVLLQLTHTYHIVAYLDDAAINMNGLDQLLPTTLLIKIPSLTDLMQ